MSELHHNFKTHRNAWRDAIVGMINASWPSGVDHDERGYWEHELKSYDEAFGSLSSQSAAPIPEQVAQASGIEGLTRYDLIVGDMIEKSLGDYVRFADVERLLATQSVQEVTQQAAKGNVLTIERIGQLIDEHTDPDFGLIVEPFARAIEADVACRFRAQGGNTKAESSDLAPTTSTVSASGALDGCDECLHTYCLLGEKCRHCGHEAEGQGYKGGKLPAAHAATDKSED